MKRVIKTLMLLMIAAGCFYVSYAFAVTGKAVSISGVADNLLQSFKPLARLITGGAFIAGFGFAIAAILKFKAHRDNPTQIPVGTPIALLFVAIGLIFLPTLFGGIGQTVFGPGATAGTISGTVTLPGSNNATGT
ncbi:MAG: type IV secretion protein IcmD [Pseudomonadota bacterium]